MILAETYSGIMKKLKKNIRKKKGGEAVMNGSIIFSLIKNHTSKINVVPDMMRQYRMAIIQTITKLVHLLMVFP